MKTTHITCICCLAGSLFLSSSVFAAGLNNEKIGVNPIPISIQEKSINNTSNGPILGAPSQKTWIFEANQNDTYKLRFSYAQPWGKNVSPAKTVEYTIQVSDGNKNDTIVNLKPGAINKVTKGQKFNISLEENILTGYSWSYNTDSKAINLIEQDNCGQSYEEYRYFQLNPNNTIK
ncbi:chagasin family peptidase inhibitor I42 [Clostridium ragsdalei P11]|uniref:Chagasin family peptidase inhibitor I42 n=1 Tax=Clostridium ragsdalei P11 TaxID=1353534 RepID=A0A1A6AJF7_9CLOT|nr:protease inhibitor I42 family protein [Clostridium ragsdalei]OBR90148.1 chagasin family peptidase inhibitor I42 [Clostridium ragsdalei P11]